MHSLTAERGGNIQRDDEKLECCVPRFEKIYVDVDLRLRRQPKAIPGRFRSNEVIQTVHSHADDIVWKR